MKFINNIKDLITGISEDTRQLKREIKIIGSETKRDIIEVWKNDAPLMGKSAEKIDRAVTTIRNIAENLPEPVTTTIDSQPFRNKSIRKSDKIVDYIKKENITKAQHLKVNRLGYSHHAISVSASEVVHYQDGEVKIESIESFAKGAIIQIVETPRLYKKGEVIARAYCKLGESKYNLFFNNCEHFVRWTLNGD